jgi:hypothetical protein
MTNLKLLHTYQTEFEVQLVLSKLETEGIEAMIQAEDRSNMLPSLDYANGYALYVEPEDFERAMAIISTTDDDLTDDMDTSGTAAADGV